MGCQPSTLHQTQHSRAAGFPIRASKGPKLASPSEKCPCDGVAVKARDETDSCIRKSGILLLPPYLSLATALQCTCKMQRVQVVISRSSSCWRKRSVFCAWWLRKRGHGEYNTAQSDFSRDVHRWPCPLTACRVPLDAASHNDHCCLSSVRSPMICIHACLASPCCVEGSCHDSCPCQHGHEHISTTGLVLQTCCKKSCSTVVVVFTVLLRKPLDPYELITSHTAWSRNRLDSLWRSNKREQLA